MKKAIKTLFFTLLVLAILSSFCAFAVSADAYPESPHNYENNTDVTWTYTHSDATVSSLDVTFSEQTYVESNYDYIYIYTSTDTLVGQYTGSELASQTINISGNGFKIRLTSDISNTNYGFSITDIQGIGGGNTNSYPESSHNYNSYANDIWTYYHDDSSVDYLNIEFNSLTYVEYNYDNIYIYTLSDKLVGQYTGDALANATVRVDGNGFKIKLTSDSTGNYYGFKINNITGGTSTSLTECDISLDNTSLEYSGSAVMPAVTVTKDSIQLIEDVDYWVTYSNNVNPGTASVIVSGKGLYKDSVEKTFTIQKASLANATVTVANVYYTGSALTPSVTVNLGSLTLSSADYTATYSNNTKVGTATVKITAKGANFTGSKSVTFKVLAPLYPESDHPYGSYLNQTWTYKYYESVDYLKIKFNANTCVEQAYGDSDEDRIYIYTSSGSLVGKYTGSELAGKTIMVKGTGFKIQLKSGYQYSWYNNYGFKIDSITGHKYISLSKCTISLSKTSVTYNGAKQTPSVTVKYGSKALKKDTDYTVAYSNNTNVGTAKVTITGKGGYTGKITKSFSIKKLSLSSATISSISSQRYTGSALKPKVTVKYGGKTISSSNYKITYSNNTKVGTATVKITAKGSNVSGSKSATFKILKPLYPQSDHPYGSYLNKTWTYKYYESVDYLKIKFNSKTYVNEDYWESDTDYIYIYTAKGTLVGKYTGNELAGKTIMVKGTGFKIKLESQYQSYWDNNYGFKIDSITGHKYVSLSKCTIRLSKTSVTYNGAKQTPSVTVKYGSKTLKKDTDYTVSYSNNTNAGTAKVTITGKGAYTGKVTKTFTIKKLSLSKVTITKISSQAYTGKAIKPKVTVKSGSKTISSSNYKITYSNNKKVGTATITIKAKGSNVTGSKKITFKITPKLSYEKKNIYKGKTFTLKLEGVSLSKVKFTSSKKSVCTVTSKGVVKGIKAGTAVITARYNGVSYKCTVKVLATASTSTTTKYYQNHDDVPDFGALLKIEPTSKKTSSTDGDYFVYSLSDLQKVDPDKEAGSKYQKLLVKCNFKKKGTTTISGKQYYKYVSDKKIVYFGIASKNGEVKIIVKKK